MNIFQTRLFELWTGENTLDLWFGLGGKSQYICDEIDYTAYIISFIVFGKEYEFYIRTKTYEKRIKEK